MSAKIYKKGEFNGNYMGIRQTKAVLAVFALVIILHHISLKMNIQLEAESFAKCIFDPFRGVGYILVPTNQWKKCSATCSKARIMASNGLENNMLSGKTSNCSKRIKARHRKFPLS